ncbi:RhuM family protein [Parabacteroides distasonis]|uniref:RhuM family protein n=1 Tax=Parabacteroides distasonis TaxID=823 RepID=UPI0028055DF3|nr:RhuM family protein [Parabacteroides distasonis]WMI41423.1 RhuM family protein [Parabacteroides distasonis]
MNENITTSFSPSTQENEIILYQPDSTVKLEVRLENETVWLTQQQMSDLFERDRTVITRHINNIFKEKELDEKSNVHFLHIANSDKPIKLYSLDVIIPVGYRVKSLRGTQFRQWANKVLKEYLLKGYSINQQLMHMENRIDHRLSEHDTQIKELSNRMDFFVRTSLPPREGILFDGQIFDAYVFICDLIKRAHKRIILIDNYIDETVLTLLNKRNRGVIATIYTKRIDNNLRLDIERHNDQYSPVDVRTAPNIHDRFLIIDDILYHIGASIKDLGKKLFAFSQMEASPATILDNL